MNLYTEATDGSYIETKETALVWHHRDADQGFASSQAKEMLGHLESVLINDAVAVKSGQFIVEVKPQVQPLSFLAFYHSYELTIFLCHPWRTCFHVFFWPKLLHHIYLAAFN